MKGTKAAPGFFQQVLKNVSASFQQASPSALEGELQAARMKLQELKLEKERSDALLQEKDAQLHLNAQAQQKLKSELTRLKKLKEFRPVLSFPLEQSLRMGGPNRTKRRWLPTPYLLWLGERYNQVKSENPNAIPKEMMVILAAKWQALSADEKRTYQEKYEAEKEAYLQVVEQEREENKALKLLHEEQKQKAALDLLKQYLQYRKDAEVDDRSKRIREKNSSKPKKPISGFFAFCKQRHATLLAEKHNKGGELLKVLGKEWNDMTKEERAPYEQIATEAKERYIQEMELYKQKEAEEASLVSREMEEHRKVEREQALRLFRKKEKIEILKKTVNEKKQKMKQKTDPNRPKRPPTSFVLFRNEMRKQLLETRPEIKTNIDALISVKWKELGDGEKQAWIDQAANAMVEYKKLMEIYNKNLDQQQQQYQICSDQEEVQTHNPLASTAAS